MTTEIPTPAALEVLSAKARKELKSLGDEAQTKAKTYEEAARLYRGILAYVATAEAAITTGSPQEQAAAFVALVAAISEANSRLKPLSAAESLEKFNLALTRVAGPSS